MLHFFLGQSKEPTVAWTEVRNIRWMPSAYDDFDVDFSLDVPSVQCTLVFAME
jgi:hypothetical protein